MLYCKILSSEPVASVNFIKRGRKKNVTWNGFGKSSLYFPVFFHSKKNGLYISCMYMYNMYRNARKHTETAHLPMPESTTSLPTELGIQTPLYCVDIALFGASVVTLILDTFWIFKTPRQKQTNKKQWTNIQSRHRIS